MKQVSLHWETTLDNMSLQHTLPVVAKCLPSIYEPFFEKVT
jgi:hypothetical protein